MIRPALSSKHKIAILYLILSALIWGAAGPVIKYTLYYIPPFTFLFLRFLVASIVILPFLIFEEIKHPVGKKDWINLILLCFLGGTLTLTFVFFGFKYTSSLDGTLISAASPMLILLASAKFLNEKITPNEKKGSVIALLGAILITLQPLFDGSFNYGTSGGLLALLGNLLIILSLVSGTAYTIWSKKILNHIPSKLGNLLHFFHLRQATRKYSPLFITALLAVVSMVTIAPFAFLEIAQIKGLQVAPQLAFEQNILTDYHLPEVSSDYIKPLLGVLYMGIFSSLVAYGMYEWAIKEVPVAETAVYANLSVIFAIPFAFLLLGETISLWFIIGGVIIGYGVYLSEKK